MTSAVARIAELAEMLEGTGITELRLNEGGDTITLRRAAGTEPVRAMSAPPQDLVVAAPCPGIFLLRHPLREEPLTVPGATVAAGTMLGLLRAGPLLVEVVAPRAGILLAIEPQDGVLVGYGTPLFRFAPETEDAPCPST